MRVQAKGKKTLAVQPCFKKKANPDLELIMDDELEQVLQRKIKTDDPRPDFAYELTKEQARLLLIRLWMMKNE